MLYILDDAPQRREFFHELAALNINRCRLVSMITALSMTFLYAVQALRYADAIKPSIQALYFSFYLAGMLIFIFLYFYLGAVIRAGRVSSYGFWWRFFVSILLVIVMGISFLNQQVNGDITLYLIGMATYFGLICTTMPEMLLTLCTVQGLFVLLLPAFQLDADIVTTHYANTYVVVVLGLFIARAQLVRNHELFNSRQHISQRSNELEGINQQLEYLNRELRIEAERDKLTGLFNRNGFDKLYAQLWLQASVSQAPVAVYMLDIDFFKNYNDDYGHLQGDECLRRVAKAIEMTVRRNNDIVARYGGEEFIVVLTGMDLDYKTCLFMADRMRTAVENLRMAGAHNVGTGYTTVSVGCSCMVPDATVTPEQLIARADKALYQAKTQGRNCAHFYE